MRRSYSLLIAIILQLFAPRGSDAELDNYDEPKPIICALPQYFIRSVYHSINDAADFCDDSSNCSGIQFWGEAAPEPEYYIPVEMGCPLFISTPSSAPNMLYFRKKTGYFHLNSNSDKETYSGGGEVGDLPEIPPIYEMITPPQEVPQYSGSDFERFNGTRCVGGYQLAASFSPAACAHYCNESFDCGGFNMEEWGACVAVTTDCVVVDDATSNYYKKPLDAFLEIDMQLIPAAPAGLPDSVQNGVSFFPLFPNYQAEVGKRCVGGSKIGDVALLVETCETRCSAVKECGGFNMLADSYSCVARTWNCSLIDEDGFVFYKRKVHSRTNTPSDEDEEPEVYVLPDEPTSSATASSIGTSPTPSSGTTELDSAAAGEPEDEANGDEESDASSEAEGSTQRPGGMYYQQFEGKRCAGGFRIGDVTMSIDQCAATCTRSDDCEGFNFNLDTGTCVARSKECALAIHKRMVFYKKVGPFLTKAKAAKEINPPSNGLPQLAKNEPISTSTPLESTAVMSTTEGNTKQPLVIEFSKMEGKRCIGGSKIGEIADGDKCLLTCSQVDNCIGFNFHPASGSCVARSSDCTLIDDAKIVFYQKVILKQTEDSATITTTEQPTTESNLPFDAYLVDLSANYTMKIGVRCLGADSKMTVVAGLEACFEKCTANDDCFGFNFAIDRQRCSLRSDYCEEQPSSSDNIIFYHKNY